LAAVGFPTTLSALPNLILNDSVNSADIADVYRRTIYPDLNFRSWSSWLAQANYIFDCLDITSNLEDYGELQVHAL
jgi:hypothetical protein